MRIEVLLYGKEPKLAVEGEGNGSSLVDSEQRVPSVVLPVCSPIKFPSKASGVSSLSRKCLG